MWTYMLALIRAISPVPWGLLALETVPLELNQSTTDGRNTWTWEEDCLQQISVLFWRSERCSINIAGGYMFSLTRRGNIASMIHLAIERRWVLSVDTTSLIFE
ncbi:hypothetical protein DENSPDRAFT_850728 [Dentipellis sp. KUC8613]|nr:hypothetical protein DENSPDRAFT_850728 [Dentipellis sp. KUC8613]